MLNINNKLLSVLIMIITILLFWIRLGTSQELPNKDESTVAYYFEMNEIDKKKLFRDIKKIREGYSVRQVKSILGATPYDKTLITKDNIFRARVLKYYVKKLDKDFVNEIYDRSIRLLFNAENRLIKIESNIEELELDKKKD